MGRCANARALDPELATIEAETIACHQRVLDWWLRDTMRSPEGDAYRQRQKAAREN